jgi:LCP family protein required for cell wall assembly
MRDEKKYKGSGFGASMDGFVSSRRSIGGNFKQYSPNKTAPKSAQAPSFENLAKRGDGFHPINRNFKNLNQSPEVDETEALLNEPIVLDDVEDKSKKKKHGAKGKSSRRRKFKRVALTLLSIAFIAGAFVAIRLYVLEKHVLRGGGKAPALAENVDISKLKGEGDGRVNVLLLGNGGPGHEGPDLTDTILLASIDPVNHNTALLSVPRDLWVKIPGDGYQKLNAAFVYGKQQAKGKTEAQKDQAGLALLDQTLSPILGVPIHYHAVVDFAAFKQTVNAIGGVTFNVPETLYDPTMAWENHGNSYLAMKGQQTFNGDKALLYARSRETSSDFARGQRQRQLIVAIKDKTFSLGTFSNPVKISNLLSSLGDNVYTDFSLDDMMRLYKIMGKIPSTSINSIDLVTPPHNLLTTGNMNGLSIVEPRAGLFDYDAIQNYVRNALKDSYIAKENAQIAIYNATDIVGMATKQSDYLKGYGYNVVTVGNTPTPTNPSKTQIIDLTKGVDKYTKNYLEKRYGVSSSTTLPPSFGITPPAGTSFVIIVGEDVAVSTQN